MFVARDITRMSSADPDLDMSDQLAAMVVVFPLCHAFYGWLNEAKSIPVAFKCDEVKNAKMCT